MRRLVLIGIPVAVFCAWAFYPAVLAYTFTFGETGTATVAACRPGSGAGRTTSLPSCHGTWRTADGEFGEGGIYNLNPHEAGGDTVQVRIGPLGPYAYGWAKIWVTPVVSGVPILLVLVVSVVVYRTRVLPGRRLTDSILTAPGALIVSDAAVHRPDDSPHVLLRALPDPPLGHRRLELPGRMERTDERPGPKGRRIIFQSVLDADEGPVMLLEHRSDAALEPETVLLDPSGAPRMIVRRNGVGRFRLLDATGAELGSARAPRGVRTPALEVRDGEGRQIAMTAKRGPKWVLRVQEEAPQPLRDAALVLALVQSRIIY
ncbi:hypothetical protein [Spirillospora sp. CA-128828]|uniref:hypothetical protein n=1 Tax=Spirillospora sp. CA-128828 TaxID=3240033 RepID=UPI003D8E6D3C